MRLHRKTSYLKGVEEVSGIVCQNIAPDVELGEDVKIFSFVNLYGCKVGDGTKIGTFVEIQKGATIGKNCKISSHTFICEGVHIGAECFIGHGVRFINDNYPRATNPDGSMQTDDDWECLQTHVGSGVAIGSGAVILGGIHIGAGAIIGAGAVVTRDIPANSIVAGNPARILRRGPERSSEKERTKRIRFVDLPGMFAPIKDAVKKDFDKTLDSMQLFLGENVKAFESGFAEFCGTSHCIGVGSGTDALMLALRALDIGPGDEVITTSHTFIATWEAIAMIGAKAVFVDINPNSLLMDTSKIEGAITERTRAILPVHLYGRAVDMQKVLEIANKYGLRVIEDASQAHGAFSCGKRVGSLGDVACFSFYFSKNLGACGEAGGITTNNDSLAERMRALRNHGGMTKYTHEFLGSNSRLDELQAIILKHKLPLLEGWNQRRREIAKLYRDGLSNTTVTLPEDLRQGEHVYHLYVIQTDNRDELMEHLRGQEIEVGVHYPKPIHQQPVFSKFEETIPDLPETERVCSRILSLPMHPCLTDEEVKRVCRAVCEFPGVSS